MSKNCHMRGTDENCHWAGTLQLSRKRMSENCQGTGMECCKVVR